MRGRALGLPVGGETGAADRDHGKNGRDAAHTSQHPRLNQADLAGRPRLRVIVNPLLELEAARREYRSATLGHYYDPDQERVRQRITRALCRLADARAAVARAWL